MGLQNGLLNAAQKAITRVNAVNDALAGINPVGADQGVRIREFRVNNVDDSQSLLLSWNPSLNDWIIT